MTSIVERDAHATHADRDETRLVERARKGDAAAFAELLDGRLEPTFRTALAILGQEADARDATQAIFVKAWQSLPSLRDPDRFPAWLGRIVVNTCRSSLRSRQRRSIREIPESAIRAQNAEPGWLDPLDRAAASGDPTSRVDQLDALERAFERLSAAERLVVWQHYYEGRSLAEIAVLVDVPVSTVKSRLFTARRSLERGLEAENR